MRKHKQCSSDLVHIFFFFNGPFTLKLMNARPLCLCYLFILKFKLKKKSFPSYELNKQRSAILPLEIGKAPAIWLFYVTGLRLVSPLWEVIQKA